MKTVFCDIDGTFIGSNHVVPEINVEAVKEMNLSSHRFVLISGRGMQHIEDLVEEHQLCCDYIFANGAGYKLYNEEPQFTNVMSLDQVSEIVDVFEAHQVIYYLHTSHGILIKSREAFNGQWTALFDWYATCGLSGATMVQFVENTYKKAMIVDSIMETLIKHPEIKPLKFEVLNEVELVKESLTNQLKDQGYFVYSSYLRNREVTLPTTNKGNAIKEYLSKYPANKTYGIGDGENDIDMLTSVDVGVAVANASEHLKSIAQVVIEDADNGSVGQFIFNHIL